MNILQRTLQRGLKLSLAQITKNRNVVYPIYFNFTQPQSKNFVMKKSELSNELLISLSMGFEHKQATNQKELTENLIINNVLKSKVVQETFNELDRDLFAINKKQKIYANNPLSIGKGQNMTSPLMHALALEEIYDRLTILLKAKKGQEIKILDIGCGRGYVAFAIAKIIQKCDDLKDTKVFIKGVDIYEDLTIGAKEIEGNLNFNKNIKFEFSATNIEQEVQSKDHIYDIIHTGVALEKKVYNDMIANIYAEKQNGSCIICPVIQEDLEQNLVMRCNSEEHIIMKCVYSQMITLKQQEVSKYFLDDGDVAEDEPTPSATQNQEKQEEKHAELLENTKMQRDIYKNEQQLKIYETQLKEFYESFRKNNNGASPTLKDMNNKLEVRNLLGDIQHIKKTIKFIKAKLQQAQQ